MCYSPEQQQYRGRAKKPRHCVDSKGYLRGIAYKINEEPGCKHEDRVARWMTDFQLIAL